MIEKLGNKSADEVYDRMNEKLVNFNSSWERTMTFGNGKVFANHHKILCSL
jgi:IS30 family transposase